MGEERSERIDWAVKNQVPPLLRATPLAPDEKHRPPATSLTSHASGLTLHVSPLRACHAASSRLQFHLIGRVFRGVAQPGSATALGAVSRGFKSRRPDQLFTPTPFFGLSAFPRPLSMPARIVPKRRTPCVESETWPIPCPGVRRCVCPRASCPRRGRRPD